MNFQILARWLKVCNALSISTRFIKNVIYNTVLLATLTMYGVTHELSVVKLVKDETSKRSKGYAFIQYTNQDDAMSALESMDEKYLDGRVIIMELAKSVKDKKKCVPKNIWTTP